MADGTFPIFTTPRPTGPGSSPSTTTTTPTLQPDVGQALGQSNRDSQRVEDAERKTSSQRESRQTSSAALHHDSSPSAAGSRATSELKIEVGALPGANHDVLMNAASVGNSQALIAELSALPAPLTPLQEAVLSTLVAMSLKAVDNVTGLFDPNPHGRDQAVKLFVPGEADGSSIHAEVSETALTALGFTGEGPSWPWVASLGMQDLLGGLLSRLPDADPLALAMRAALGRDCSMLQPGVQPRALFAALSQANAPLNLPMVLQLQTEGGPRTFVVAGTFMGADGAPTVSLLDVAGLLGGAGQKAENMNLEEVLARLHQLLLPDGHASSGLSPRHKEALRNLGLTGCCMTNVSRAAAPGSASPRAAGVRSQGGLLENRCLTCPAAQAACVPQGG